MGLKVHTAKARMACRMPRAWGDTFPLAEEWRDILPQLGGRDDFEV